jgi:hypothetical protein
LDIAIQKKVSSSTAVGFNIMAEEAVIFLSVSSTVIDNKSYGRTLFEPSAFPGIDISNALVAFVLLSTSFKISP